MSHCLIFILDGLCQGSSMTLKHTQCLQDDIGAVYTLIPVLSLRKNKTVLQSGFSRLIHPLCYWMKQ